MPIEGAFAALRDRTAALLELAVELGVTVAEDRPLEGAAAPVDRVDAATVDLIGWLEGASRAALTAHDAATFPPDLARASRSLRVTHELVDRASRQLHQELVAYERVDELRTMSAERGPEWRAWTESLRDGMGRCEQALYGVSAALLCCWSELAERLSRGRAGADEFGSGTSTEE